MNERARAIVCECVGSDVDESGGDDADGNGKSSARVGIRSGEAEKVASGPSTMPSRTRRSRPPSSPPKLPARGGRPEKDDESAKSPLSTTISREYGCCDELDDDEVDAMDASVSIDESDDVASAVGRAGGLGSGGGGKEGGGGGILFADENKSARQLVCFSGKAADVAVLWLRFSKQSMSQRPHQDEGKDRPADEHSETQARPLTRWPSAPPLAGS